MYLSKVIDISSYTRTYIFVFTKGTLYELQIKFQLILTHSNLTYYRWENSSRDIIQCTQCGGTICVAFHPSLNEESRTNVCQKYMEMLVTSHCNTCPFRSYAARWSKVMQHKQQTCEEGDGDNSTHSQSGATKTISENNDASNRLNKVSEALLGNSKTNFYVPPYLLPLSNDLLRFEDCTEDGSITRDNIKEGALKIHDKLQAMDIGGSSKLRELMVPEIVTKYCNEKFPGIDLDDVLCQKNITMKTPYLLSTFGWSICDNDDEPETLDERKNKDAVVVKCNICQARATLLMQSTEAEHEDDGEGSRKRCRIDSIQDGIKLKLLDSHRGHCPYVAGFSYGCGQQSEEGWKVVLSCLEK